MKANLAKCLALMAALTTAGHAATVIWGSEFGANLFNSQGAVLDGSYIYELGAFDSTFTPSAQNTAYWYAHWNTFDSTTYSTDYGGFTSSATMDRYNGTSNGNGVKMTGATSGFAGLDAYLWIRSVDQPVAGSEVLLARPAADWKFPELTPQPPVTSPQDNNCCDENTPLRWSVSNLSGSSLAPVYGYQSPDAGERQGYGGANVPEVSGGSYGQTSSFTVVPEPCSSVMMLVLGALALLDRRRLWGL
ncbi:MAG: hypothetical protein WCP45_06190 [Verrucomicrobiota bacterium]